MPASKPFLTVEDVAERLQVSERTVRRWIDDGALSVHRFGRSVRIDERDFLTFLAEHREA